MHTRRTLIIANWKMNLTVGQASHLSANLHKHIRGHRDVEVVLAPNMLALQPLSMEIDRRRFRLAAQNAYHKDEGAFTGEVSVAMLHDIVHYILLGHSERRIYFGETNENVRDKVAASIRNDIAPVICVGETSTERADGQSRQVVHDQLTVALSNVTPDDMHKVVIAYEPVWAISTFGGKTAVPSEMQKMFDFIRKQIHDLYGAKAAENVRVLYGGSVNSHNASSYLNIDGCDGLLVGGSSLNYHQFAQIVETAYKLNRTREDD